MLFRSEKHKIYVTMFYAVHENGMVDMKLEFDRLHKSGNILFFAEDFDYGSYYRYYLFIDINLQRVQLALNGCKLNCIVRHFEDNIPCVEFEIESPNYGIERVEVYRQHPLFPFHLSRTADIISTINKFGYEAYRKYDLRLK